MAARRVRLIPDSVRVYIVHGGPRAYDEPLIGWKANGVDGKQYGNLVAGTIQPEQMDCIRALLQNVLSVVDR